MIGPCRVLFIFLCFLSMWTVIIPKIWSGSGHIWWSCNCMGSRVKVISLVSQMHFQAGCKYFHFYWIMAIWKLNSSKEPAFIGLYEICQKIPGLNLFTLNVRIIQLLFLTVKQRKYVNIDFSLKLLKLPEFQQKRFYMTACHKGCDKSDLCSLVCRSQFDNILFLSANRPAGAYSSIHPLRLW